MILKSLIIEQLESDGALRTFKMQWDPSIGDLAVAMIDADEEDSEGPFHFLDDKYAGRYKEAFAQCRVRRVGKKYFYKHEDEYYFETGVAGIPTEPIAGFGLSYYVLSLPQYGILTYLSVRDARLPTKEFRRTVMRDDRRNCFVIYLECRSSHGTFDFELTCRFRISETKFSSAEYHDGKTDVSRYREPPMLDMHLNKREMDKVEKFFSSEPVLLQDSTPKAISELRKPAPEAGTAL